MKNYAHMCILLILLELLFFAANAGTDTAQAAKPADSVSMRDSNNNEVKFEYRVAQKQCDDAFFDIKNTHSIVKNTVKVQFIRGGTACTYVCRLIMKSDTLNISSACDPGSEQLHRRCICIFCKITGLKKGIYYLNYGEGYKKIKIK